uniref:DUF7596 domain-containing protein n=1 Tax=Plectus sambesii TaxID=2011161 RepID=A0A914WTA3_9BILA
IVGSPPPRRSPANLTVEVDSVVVAGQVFYSHTANPPTFLTIVSESVRAQPVSASGIVHTPSSIPSCYCCDCPPRRLCCISLPPTTTVHPSLLVMVAQTDVSGLIQNSKAAQMLNGSLLPRQSANGTCPDKPAALLQLNEATTAVVLDAEGRDVVALAAVLRYAPMQAYCVLAEVDEQLQRKTGRIEPVANSMWCDAAGGEHIGMKFALDDTKKDLRLQPMFVQAHIRPESRVPLEHMIDAVTEKALGIKNLELKKNTTVDLYEGTYDSNVWRDRIGFCVTDRCDYAELTVASDALRKQLANIDISEVKVQPLGADTMQQMVEYDHAVSQLNREEYLSFLTSLKGIVGAVAYDSADQVTGYALALGTNLLQCYAETESAAAALVCHMSKAVGQSMTLNTAVDSFLGVQLASIATKRRAIQRFHTRAVPSQVKWEKVFVLNIGTHLL